MMRMVVMTVMKMMIYTVVIPKMKSRDGEQLYFLDQICTSGGDVADADEVELSMLLRRVVKNCRRWSHGG